MDIARKRSELMHRLTHVEDEFTLVRIAMVVGESTPTADVAHAINDIQEEDDQVTRDNRTVEPSQSFDEAMAKLNNAGMSTNDFNELIEIAAQAVEATEEDDYVVAVGMAAMTKRLCTSPYFMSLNDLDKHAFIVQLEEKLREVTEEVVEFEGIRIPESMIRNAIETGAEDMDSIVAFISAKICLKYSEASERQVRGAVMEYARMVSQGE